MKTMKTSIGILFTFLWLQLHCISRGENVKQHPSAIMVQEGKKIVLNCSYSDSASNYFYWYKKEPGKSLQFIIYLFSNTPKDQKQRYTVLLNKNDKQLTLHIEDIQPGDSAVYFCAVSHRWDTAQLHFGRGTQLIVEPKPQPPAKPSVFVMKNGTNVACLVKDFYPKTVNISLQSSKVIKEYNPSVVLSPSGKYSAVKLGQYEDSDSVTCSVQHNSAIVNSVDFAPKENSLDNVPDRVTDYEKTTESKNKMETSVRLHKPKVHIEKVNMMSLTILGLRMLFAKSVAINFLLTAKLFFF